MTGRGGAFAALRNQLPAADGISAPSGTSRLASRPDRAITDRRSARNSHELFCIRLCVFRNRRALPVGRRRRLRSVFSVLTLDVGDPRHRLAQQRC